MPTMTRYLATTTVALAFAAVPFAAASTERCLGPAAAEVLQAQFLVSIGEEAELDSMMVEKESVTLTVKFQGSTYAFAGHGRDDAVMVFATQTRPPMALTALISRFSQTLPASIWSDCGGSDDHQEVESSAAMHDLSHLPPDACRPVPGHYCFDRYWTLPPRWTITGALVAYWLHVLAFVALLGAGIWWAARR